MIFKKIKNISFIFLTLLFCVGFRVYPDRKWAIDQSSTAKKKVFITLTDAGNAINNNLPASDALGAAGATLTETQMLTSILNDYNNINSSFLILALDSDTDFAANSTNRRISIESGSASGVSSGEANPQFSGSSFTSCKISLTSQGYRDAKTYIALVTHELGHCVGLEHPQDTIYAAMSYFKENDIYRLAIDDKMGIVHLYPEDPSYADEAATYGLGCSRR